MDGYLAQLDRICDLAERYDALVMVDDSHAVGFVGPGGRGTPEHHGVIERVDIVTGTLGKALGGASGGYVSGRREIVELLRQRSRPYLFSNSVAPPIVAAIAHGARADRELGRAARPAAREHRALPRADDRARLRHPARRAPDRAGDARRRGRPPPRFSARLVELGVYVVSFSFPVVPRGTARIRTQMSAAHTTDDLDFAADQFAAARAAA